MIELVGLAALAVPTSMFIGARIKEYHRATARIGEINITTVLSCAAKQNRISTIGLLSSGYQLIAAMDKLSCNGGQRFVARLVLKKCVVGIGAQLAVGFLAPSKRKATITEYLKSLFLPSL